MAIATGPRLSYTLLPLEIRQLISDHLISSALDRYFQIVDQPGCYFDATPDAVFIACLTDLINVSLDFSLQLIDPMRRAQRILQRKSEGLEVEMKQASRTTDAAPTRYFQSELLSHSTRRRRRQFARARAEIRRLKRCSAAIETMIELVMARQTSGSVVNCIEGLRAGARVSWDGDWLPSRTQTCEVNV